MTDRSHLDRRLGVTDAVVIGLGSMIGAGIFAAMSPQQLSAVHAKYRTPLRAEVPTLGLIGCLVVAFALPLDAVMLGAGVFLVGAVVYAVGRRG